MKRLFALMVICCVLLIEYPALTAKSIDLHAESITSGLIKRQLIVPPSQSQSNLNLNEAYAIQKAVTTEMKTKGYLVTGFKTALTSGAAQMRYRNKKPVYGLLFNRGKLPSGSEIDSKRFIRLLVGCKIGFLVREKISDRVKDYNTLKEKLEAVFPVVELADCHFSKSANVKLADIVATSDSSAYYVVGNAIECNKVNLLHVGGALGVVEDNSEDIGCIGLKTQLTRNRRVFSECHFGKAGECPCQLLIWLINQSVEHGWSIEPGQILLTGSSNEMEEGKPGKYEANFGLLGKVNFAIK